MWRVRPNPEIRDLLQHPALVRDGIRHHYIEGGNPVGRHDEHRVRVHGVDVPYLAFMDFFESSQGSTEDSWRLHGMRPFWCKPGGIPALATIANVATDRIG